MQQTYTLFSQNCTSCTQFAKGDELGLDQGKIYGKNIFNIPDNFTPNSGSVRATNFYGLSISEFGRFIYKSNNEQFELQKMAFPNVDSVYATRKNNKWVLGIS
tara:strand:+ start:39 stop:347 length:309 start_codon:yes stop_codon:yes gene_type:complete